MIIFDDFLINVHSLPHFVEINFNCFPHLRVLKIDGICTVLACYIGWVYKELGRHRGREGRKECLLCDAKCESISHVLWDCPAYASIRSAFM